MELHQVRYFLAVYEAVNFTRAAERSGVSQPALTAAIKKLEEEVGGPLFHRDRAGVKLSPLGELLLPRLQRIASDHDSVGEIAKSYKLLASAPLRIGILATIGPAHLATRIQSFKVAAPGVELEVRLLPFRELLGELEEAKLEIAIASVPAKLPDWVVRRRLYEERYVVAFAGWASPRRARDAGAARPSPRVLHRPSRVRNARGRRGGVP